MKKFEPASSNLEKARTQNNIFDVQVIRNEIDVLRAVVEKYELRNIFNLDETALFYRLQPNKTLASKALNGTRTSKDRFSVAVCSNADGSDKRRLVVIGKFAKPWCFGKFDPSTIVEYYSNAKAWMTSKIFNIWLTGFNKKMRNENREVLLLLDNASSHKVEGEYSNVKVYYLPPNTTSMLQLMDAGIIKTLKSYYKNNLVKHLLSKIEVESAWSRVSSKTISNCFLHCQYFSKNQENRSNDLVSEQANTKFELKTNMEKFNSIVNVAKSDVISVEEFLDCDDLLPTGEKLSVDDIVQLVKDDEGSKEDENDVVDVNNNNEEREINHKDALLSLTNLESFFSNSSSFTTKDVDLLNHLK
ncbi:unnamed protein product [Brachionus calyciflorus]|uniref:DDE-1 domain-containing protein n=1 Tax=Brachionus calyciflorus TaxID=104777 RepID=A0A814MBA0_9BILA|nr:unnamed protein product [Brachionus calyciflorus]